VSVLTTEEAASFADQHLREALVAGVDFNHFCAKCFDASAREDGGGHLCGDLTPEQQARVDAEHACCTGDASYEWDKASDHFKPQACLCACSTARAKRGSP
jgi:hypothetical protein